MNLKLRSLIATLVWSMTAMVQQAPAASPTQRYDPEVMTAAFLRWHPDLEYRLLGTQALRQQDNAVAMRHFRRAAYYADKPSQAMLAEMYLQGLGVSADPALAYAWMTLASERGYPDFVAMAGRYRTALDPAQHEQAQKHMQALKARYADAAAKPRIAAHIRRGRSEITGSRTGKAENLTIKVYGTGGFEQQLDGSRFYSPRYWDPVQYQQWHDQTWQTPHAGEVEVGDPQPTRSPAPAPASKGPAA